MTFFEALFLGILQGITEFLPISSSGHLVLMETVFGLEVAELKSFDVVLHLGTLLAILLYFWRDLIQPKYWPWLVLGSVPAVIVGVLFEDLIDATFRNAISVGILMIVMGLLFQLPERCFKQNKKLKWPHVIAIGLAQAAAIIPGVSRSGATILTGTLLGLTREEAARFSFMLGAIAIAGAGFLTALDLTPAEIDLMPTVVGFFASFGAGLLSVTWLMHYLRRHSFRAFGVYRLFLGALILIIAAL